MRMTTRLNFKEEIDSIGHIKVKPPTFVGGPTAISECGVLKDGKLDVPIILDTPNSYNKKGVFMSQGFVILPRSLWNDVRWIGCKEKYKKVFLTILMNCAFKPTEFNIDNNIVKIEVAQFCISFRDLAELCNKGVRFKADKIDKNIVERSVSLFLQFGFVRHEVRHDKSIITITYKEIYDQFKNASETSSETRPRHNRDTNEELEEREDSSFKKKTIKEKDSDRSKISPSLKKEVSEEDVLVINSVCEDKRLKIRDYVILSWLKKHECSYVMENLMLLDKAIENQKGTKNPVGNQESWMESALKRNYQKIRSNIEKNREFISCFKKEKNWESLRILKIYCVDDEMVEEYNFSLTPEIFQTIVENAERKRNIYNET